jgi:predicted TIM-barrel fold metal-dependent hydrolase
MKKKMFNLSLFVVIVMFAGACSILPSSELANESTEPYPIIDMHMHTYQWNKYGDPPQPNLITGNVPEARTDVEALDAYLAEMDRHNIVLAVGSGELEMISAMQSQAEGRFLGGLEFPRYTAPVNNRSEYWPELDELRQLFESGQLQVMGEVTAQYAGVAPNDPKLEPYYALAEELDIPFCLHTGFGPPNSPYMGDPDFRMRYGNPLLLEDVLVAHPHLRIYIAHGGYPFIEETIAVMMMYPQVYVDISAINWLLTPAEFHAYLKQLMDARLGKRILFGTDQMIWPEAVEMSINAIESATFLTEEQKQDIYFNNAANFLKLDKSKYLPGATEYYDDDGNRVVEVVTTEIRMRPAKVGDQESVTVNLSLNGATSTAIVVTGFDIDDVSETDMLVNGQNVPLPPEIVADVAPKTVTVELEDGVLVEGENTITFVFANDYEGTTGFSIVDVRILLRE